MGNWFGKTGRGFIMGVWSSNASVGNIIARILNFTNLKVTTTVEKTYF